MTLVDGPSLRPELMTRVEDLADMTLIDENIARGRTDLWVDTITGGTFS